MTYEWMPAKELYATVASKSTISDWEKDEVDPFPPGIALTPKAKVWARAEVNAWIERRAQRQNEIMEARNKEGARLIRLRHSPRTAKAAARKASEHPAAGGGA